LDLGFVFLGFFGKRGALNRANSGERRALHGRRVIARNLDDLDHVDEAAAGACGSWNIGSMGCWGFLQRFSEWLDGAGIRQFNSGDQRSSKAE
jgi:hypothetical protein